jgi:leucyl-tRNA synthetase
MSKSRGNVVNPDEVVSEYGADTMRLYEMFMGAFDQPIPWSTQGVVGMHRFLNRVWNLKDRVADVAPVDAATERTVHQTIRKVGERVEAMKFNTAVAALMELANSFGAAGAIAREHWRTFVLLLSPFAPHIAEELWEALGHSGSIARERWPEYDEAKAAEEELEVPVQVNGRLRARLTVPAGTAEDEIKWKALAAVARHTEGKEVKKVILVGGAERPRLVSVVAK